MPDYSQPTTKLVSHPAIDGLTPQKRAFILVALQTLFGAAAQVLMKKGAATVPQGEGLLQMVVRLVTTPYLFFGYCLYGLAAILMILALRRGQLSLLYPVIALTFVWVAILSVVIFNEVLTPWRIAGIGSIMIGVGILGTSK